MRFFGFWGIIEIGLTLYNFLGKEYFEWIEEIF